MNLRGDCFRLELPSPLANFPTLGRVATASARGEKKGVLSRRIYVQKFAQDFRYCNLENRISLQNQNQDSGQGEH